jgi:hypothetical protein
VQRPPRLSARRHAQLPAYAIYKPHQIAVDPALRCLESSILQVASSLEEAQADAAWSSTRRTRKPKRRASR